MDITTSTKNTSYNNPSSVTTSYVHYHSTFPKTQKPSKPTSIIKKHIQHAFKPPSQTNNNHHPTHSLYLPHHTSLPLTSITSSYITNITQAHEQSKQKTTQTITSLQNEITSVRSHITSTVNAYEHKIKTLQHQHACELVSLRSQCASHYTTEITHKDNELKQLLLQNTELTQSNEDLLNKLTQYLDTINTTQQAHINTVNHLHSDNNSLKNDINTVKTNYERKMKLLQHNFEEEKNALIYHYECIMKELKEGYEQSQVSYNKMIQQKECNVNEVVQVLKNENEKLKLGCKENGDKINKLMEDNIKLNNDNKKVKYEIECVRKELERVKKESMCYFEKRNQIENDLHKLNKEHNAIKTREEQLHRLTYGKLKQKNKLKHTHMK